jgi:hypothetical protein
MPNSKGKKNKPGTTSAPAQSSGTATLPATYGTSRKTFQQIEELDRNHPDVGWLCLYKVFAHPSITNDSMATMGQEVAKYYVAVTGELVDHKINDRQGFQMSADDGRAMIVLAKKYGFTGPRGSRHFAAVLFGGGPVPVGTVVIGFGTWSAGPSGLAALIPDQGESSSANALKAITDPALYSVEFHAIRGTVTKASGGKNSIDWYDPQPKKAVFPNGPPDGKFFIWFEKRPS